MEKRIEFGKKYISFVFVLWFGTEVLFNSNIEQFFIWKKSDANSSMAIIILILLMIQIIFFQDYQIKELVIIAIVSLPIIYATSLANYNTLLSTWIFVIASKNIDLKKLTGIAYYVQLIMVIVVLVLFFNGYVNENSFYRGTVLRHSLGFTHPNQLGIRVFLIFICRCFHRKDRLNILDAIVTFIAAIVLNIVTNSQTSVYCMILLSIIICAYELATRMRLNMNAWSNFFIVLAIVSNSVSVFLSIIDVKKHNILKHVDDYMSHRFSQCHRTIGFYGINLFGQDIKLTVKKNITGVIYHFWLDNAYVSLILRYGVIVFFIFSALYICTMVYLKRTQQFLLIAILGLYAIYGIMENNFFAMAQNLFLLTLSYPIYHRISGNKKDSVRKVRIRITV